MYSECCCQWQVGAKGNMKNVNRGLDCDVIVAEVKQVATSQLAVVLLAVARAQGSKSQEQTWLVVELPLGQYPPHDDAFLTLSLIHI